jgi:hypothetical protein
MSNTKERHTIDLETIACERNDGSKFSQYNS